MTSVAARNVSASFGASDPIASPALMHAAIESLLGLTAFDAWALAQRVVSNYRAFGQSLSTRRENGIAVGEFKRDAVYVLSNSVHALTNLMGNVNVHDSRILIEKNVGSRLWLRDFPGECMPIADILRSCKVPNRRPLTIVTFPDSRMLSTNEDPLVTFFSLKRRVCPLEWLLAQYGFEIFNGYTGSSFEATDQSLVAMMQGIMSALQSVAISNPDDYFGWYIAAELSEPACLLRRRILRKLPKESEAV